MFKIIPKLTFTTVSNKISLTASGFAPGQPDDQVHVGDVAVGDNLLANAYGTFTAQVELPISSVDDPVFSAGVHEVKIDDGPWQPATLDPETAREKYGWKFFNYTWDGATPGEHTVTSRATDANGVVQPTAEELDFELGGVKQTFLEHNAQLTRPVIIA